MHSRVFVFVACIQQISNLQSNRMPTSAILDAMPGIAAGAGLTLRAPHLSIGPDGPVSCVLGWALNFCSQRGAERPSRTLGPESCWPPRSPSSKMAAPRTR